MMMIYYIGVCRRGLKVNADKSKVRVLFTKEGSVSELLIDGTL